MTRYRNPETDGRIGWVLPVVTIGSLLLASDYVNLSWEGNGEPLRSGFSASNPYSVDSSDKGRGDRYDDADEATESGDAAGLSPSIKKGLDEQTGRVVHTADGDTMDVDIDGDGTSVPKRIRVTGINTRELKNYSHDNSKIRGECHGVAATIRGRELLNGQRVRITARDARSQSGDRLRRSIAYHKDGKWHDYGTTLIRESLAFPHSNGSEWSWNKEYLTLAKQVAKDKKGVWSPTACGVGPDPDAQLSVALNNADEVVTITNKGTKPVPLGGWGIGDSYPRRFILPGATSIPAGGSIRVHTGSGRNTDTDIYWGLPRAAYENESGPPRNIFDHAYLVDSELNLRAWSGEHEKAV